MLDQQRSKDRQRSMKIIGKLRSLWHEAKNDVRQQKYTLTAQYKFDIAQVQNTVAQLEANMKRTNLEKEQLQEKLRKAIMEKEQAMTTLATVERRYQVLVGQKEKEIISLQNNVVQLQQEVAQKDQQIQSYHTSYRAILRLARDVTSGKIAGTTSRLRNAMRMRGVHPVGDVDSVIVQQRSARKGRRGEDFKEETKLTKQDSDILFSPSALSTPSFPSQSTTVLTQQRQNSTASSISSKTSKKKPGPLKPWQ
jgi:hypothetical protein